MSSGRWFGVLGATAGAAVLLTASVGAGAQDRPAAVVLEFEGPDAGLARVAVVNGVSKMLRLLPRRRVQSTATRLGVSWDQQADRARIARHLGIELFVLGSVRAPRRGGLRTTLRVLDVEGTELATVQTGTPRGAAGGRRVRQAAIDVVTEALRNRPALPAEPPPPEPPPPEPQIAQPPPAQVRPPASVEPPAAERRESARRGYSERDRRALEAEQEAPRERRGAEPIVHVLAGARYGRRTLLVAVNDDSRSRRYDGGIWELVADARLRPFARSTRWPRRLSIAADASHSLALESVDPNGKTLHHRTFRLAGALAADLMESPATLTLVLGAGTEAFVVDKNNVLPSRQGTFILGGLRLAYPLVDRLLRVEAFAGGRWFPVVIGTERAFGIASAWGGEAAANLGGDVYAFSYGIGVSFRRDRLSFRDGVGEDGHEQSIAASLSVGWVY